MVLIYRNGQITSKSYISANDLELCTTLFNTYVHAESGKSFYRHITIDGQIEYMERL